MSYPPKPQVILFDWDQTLVDNWQLFFQAMNYTLNHFGHESWSEQETRLRIGSSARQAFESLFKDQATEASSFYYNYVVERHLETLRPMPGAPELLEKTQQQKIPVAIVSNKRGPLLRKEISHLGWNHYFAQVVGAGDTEFDKPHTAPATHALSQLGVKEKLPIWFIGDHPVDMECAHRSGCLPILMDPHNHPEEAFGDYPPAFRFSSLTALKNFVEDF